MDTTSRFWSPQVQTLAPYIPGEQPHGKRLIKLNTNENPYGLSPMMREAIRLATNLRSDFTLDRHDFDGPSGGIVIANPNAPTGMALGIFDIEDILQYNRD